MSDTKRCPRCEQILPLTEFSKNTGRRDGVGAYCRPCGRRYSEQRRRSKGAKPRRTWQPLAPGEPKECRHCHRVLDAVAFAPAKQNSDGRDSYCRTCKTEARREWGANNPERRNAIQREYWARKTAEAKGRPAQE